MPNTRRALTLPEREQRRAEQRELARASIDQLRTSDGWQAYLKARRRFPSYSWRNVLLILSQRPTATRVAGFRAWLELGYCVTKGSKGIRIWARCAPSRKRMQAWRNAGADPDEMPRATYKLVSVFDRLSRVRSGGCRRRPSPEIRCLPVSRLCCSSAHAPRRYPREHKRADQTPECCIAGVRWAAAVASVGATPGVPHQQPARGSTALPLRPVGPLPGFGRLATWLLGPPEARRARRARGREDGWTRPPTR
jgi:hypothetical protein